MQTEFSQHIGEPHVSNNTIISLTCTLLLNVCDHKWRTDWGLTVWLSFLVTSMVWYNVCITAPKPPHALSLPYALTCINSNLPGSLKQLTNYPNGTRHLLPEEDDWWAPSSVDSLLHSCSPSPGSWGVSVTSTLHLLTKAASMIGILNRAYSVQDLCIDRENLAWCWELYFWAQIFPANPKGQIFWPVFVPPCNIQRQAPSRENQNK